MGWPGENLVIRLWETLEKSGVGLFRPMQVRRVGKAETDVAVERMLFIAQAEKQIKCWTEVPAETLLLNHTTADAKEEVLAQMRVEPNFNAERFELEVTSAQTVEFLRKEVNIQKSVAQAEAILQQDETKVPEKTVDIDWFIRWRDYASLMSSEDVQNLWGNLLAGEIKSPGTYAYRTLDFLRNLSQDEAKLVERLGSLIVDREMLFFGRGMTLKTKRVSIELPISQMDLDILEELGVLVSASGMGYSSNALPSLQHDGKYAHLFACGKRGLVALTSEPQKKYTVAFYGLSKLGKNVMTLVNSVPDETYLLAVGKMLQDDGFEVLIADVVDIGEQRRSFTNTVPLPYPEEPSAPATP